MTRLAPRKLESIALLVATPASWAAAAVARLPELVADHAVCELQAAVFSMSLVGSYSRHEKLVDRLSALAAEELRHFRRATREARRLGARLPSKRRNAYVAALRASCRPAPEPDRGLDLMLVGALIEARSHERFLALVPHLDARLARLYRELAEAEERHGPIYLDLAREHAGAGEAERRLAQLLLVEAEAISGPPGREMGVHSKAQL